MSDTDTIYELMVSYGLTMLDIKRIVRCLKNDSNHICGIPGSCIDFTYDVYARIGEYSLSNEELIQLLNHFYCTETLARIR